MSISDVAEYLGVNDRTVRNMVADGRLRAYTCGDRLIRLRRSEVDAAPWCRTAVTCRECETPGRYNQCHVLRVAAAATHPKWHVEAVVLWVAEFSPGGISGDLRRLLQHNYSFSARSRCPTSGPR
jgi:excisionase family DNA binding protein